MRYLYLLFASILFWSAPCLADEIKTTADLKAAYPTLVSQIESEAKGEVVNQSSISVEKDAKGQRTQWSDETRDSKGTLLKKRVNTYTYYKTGEVDTITLNVFDENLKLVSTKEIKHFLDGKQPEVKNVLVETDISK